MTNLTAGQWNNGLLATADQGYSDSANAFSGAFSLFGGPPDYDFYEADLSGSGNVTNINGTGFSIRNYVDHGGGGVSFDLFVPLAAIGSSGYFYELCDSTGEAYNSDGYNVLAPPNPRIVRPFVMPDGVTWKLPIDYGTGTSPVIGTFGVGWTPKIGGVAKAFSGVALDADNNGFTATCTTQALKTDTLTLDYAPAGIADSGSHDMLAFTGLSVINYAGKITFLTALFDGAIYINNGATHYTVNHTIPAGSKVLFFATWHAMTGVTDSRGNTYTSDIDAFGRQAISIWSANIETALEVGDTLTANSTNRGLAYAAAWFGIKPAGYLGANVYNDIDESAIRNTALPPIDVLGGSLLLDVYADNNIEMYISGYDPNPPLYTFNDADNGTVNDLMVMAVYPASDSTVTMSLYNESGEGSFSANKTHIGQEFLFGVETMPTLTAGVPNNLTGPTSGGDESSYRVQLLQDGATQLIYIFGSDPHSSLGWTFASFAPGSITVTPPLSAANDGHTYNLFWSDSSGNSQNYYPSQMGSFTVVPGDTDTTPPTPSSASINSAGTTLTVHWTETGSAPVLPSTGGTGLSLAGLSHGAATLSSVNTTGTVTTATISRAIFSDETPTLSGTSTNFTDSADAPNAVADFSGFAITNDSTDTYVPPAPDAPSAPSLSVMSSTAIDVTTPAYGANTASWDLQRAPDSSGSPGTWATTDVGAAASSTVHVTGLSPGAKYWFRLVAHGDGGATNGASASATAKPSAPTAPTLTAVSGSRIDVAVPALSGGAAAYDVQRAPDVSGSPGSWATVQSSATPSSAFHDSGLSAGTTYWYRLAAIDGGGATYGASGSATTLATDTAAPAYASSATASDGTYVDVTFTETGSPPLLPATGVTGFTVKANGAARAVSSAVRHADTVIRLTLASPVSRWDVVSVEYDAATGNVTDSA